MPALPAALAVLLSLPSAAAPVPGHYGLPATTLTGRVVVRQFYGPPGYGAAPEMDSKVRRFILVLDAPLDVAASKDPDEARGVAETGVREVSLDLGDARLRDFLKAFAGRRVTVIGKLFHAIAPGDHTPVLLDVSAAEEADVRVIRASLGPDLRLQGPDLKSADRADPLLEKALAAELAEDRPPELTDPQAGEEYKDGMPYAVYWYDLDGDGKPEAIVDMSPPSTCGSGGCTLGIYRLGKDGRYECVGGLQGFPPYVVSTRHKSHGWLDIVMAARHVDHDAGDGLYLMKYDGTRYDSVKDADRVPDREVVHGVLLVSGPALHVRPAKAP